MCVCVVCVCECASVCVCECACACVGVGGGVSVSMRKFKSGHKTESEIGRSIDVGSFLMSKVRVGRT